MKKKSWIIFGVYSAVFVAALIVLTPYDFKITSSLYNPGVWINKTLEVLGPIFMPFFSIFACVSLFIQTRLKSKVKQWLVYIGLGFLYIYTIFMGIFTLKYSYAPYLFVPAIVLYAFFTGFTIFLNLKVVKNENRARFIKLCLVFFIVTMTSLVVTDIIKIIFSRGRFHEILAGEVEYRPWYCFTWRFQINSSFPSGHTTRAGTSLCFGALVLYKTRNKIWTLIVEIVAIVFTIGVAISRLFEGMHFAIDILTGFYLITISYFISKTILINDNEIAAFGI